MKKAFFSFVKMGEGMNLGKWNPSIITFSIYNREVTIRPADSTLSWSVINPTSSAVSWYVIINLSWCNNGVIENSLVFYTLWPRFPKILRFLRFLRFISQNNAKPRLFFILRFLRRFLGLFRVYNTLSQTDPNPTILSNFKPLYFYYFLQLLTVFWPFSINNRYL